MNINSKFYPVTSEVSRILRSAKLTAAEWRIWSYLIEIEPWGDAYQDISTLTVMQECDVSKATYYRALAKFQELELFDFQDKGISIRNLKGVSSLKNETAVSRMRQQSQECDSGLKNETAVSKMRQQSQECDNQRSEPLPNNASTVPQTIQTYSDFKKSLSDSERENFEKFVREEYYKDTGKKIRSFNSFMGNDHFQEWLEIWNNRPEAVFAIATDKWRNHPQFENWLSEIERTRNPFEFAGSDKEKQSFIDWCWETKQYSWLKEEG
ncbi:MULTISPECIES: hypothetical protein [Nostocales]|uniref:Uncharacterized protein n=2 Tax=Tolypothrix TaxID=111782 RepID=A0A0C1NB51_9CYAN